MSTRKNKMDRFNHMAGGDEVQSKKMNNRFTGLDTNLGEDIDEERQSCEQSCGPLKGTVEDEKYVDKIKLEEKKTSFSGIVDGRSMTESSLETDDRYDSTQIFWTTVKKKDFSQKHIPTMYTDDPTKDEMLGNDKRLSSDWTVWVHGTACENWTVDSYKNVYTISSIGTFWRFFNNFHAYDKFQNEFFIMRDKIKPIWEDNANRKGGICSIKLECFNKPGKIDIGIETMICLCILIMNETFCQQNEEINGISYTIKNRSVLIKIWYRDHDFDMKRHLPMGFFTKLDEHVRKMSSEQNRRIITGASIQCKKIMPQYHVAE